MGHAFELVYEFGGTEAPDDRSPGGGGDKCRPRSQAGDELVLVTRGGQPRLLALPPQLFLRQQPQVLARTAPIFVQGSWGEVRMGGDSKKFADLLVHRRRGR